MPYNPLVVSQFHCDEVMVMTKFRLHIVSLRRTTAHTTRVVKMKWLNNLEFLLFYFLFLFLYLENPWKKPTKTCTHVLRIGVLQRYRFSYPNPYPSDPYAWPPQVSKPMVFPSKDDITVNSDSHYDYYNYYYNCHHPPHHIVMPIHLWHINGTTCWLHDKSMPDEKQHGFDFLKIWGWEWATLMKMGPNNTSGLAWALGTSVF